MPRIETKNKAANILGISNLKLDSKEFELERKVVLEERRSRVNDNPVNYLFEKLRQKAFKSHTYANPIIGWEKDITKISLKNMETFYKKFYVLVQKSNPQK